jgi:hypothetical protein
MPGSIKTTNKIELITIFFEIFTTSSFVDHGNHLSIYKKKAEHPYFLGVPLE